MSKLWGSLQSEPATFLHIQTFFDQVYKAFRRYDFHHRSERQHADQNFRFVARVVNDRHEIPPVVRFFRFFLEVSEMQKRPVQGVPLVGNEQSNFPFPAFLSVRAESRHFHRRLAGKYARKIERFSESATGSDHAEFIVLFGIFQIFGLSGQPTDPSLPRFQREF